MLNLQFLPPQGLNQYTDSEVRASADSVARHNLKVPRGSNYSPLEVDKPSSATPPQFRSRLSPIQVDLPSTGSPPPTPADAGISPSPVRTGSPPQTGFTPFEGTGPPTTADPPSFRPMPQSGLPSSASAAEGFGAGAAEGAGVVTSGLSGAAGAIGLGAAAAAATSFASRLASGQSVSQAAAGAAASGAGAAIGGLVGGAVGTAIAPGLGSAIGVAVGSAIGSAIGDRAIPSSAEPTRRDAQSWNNLSYFQAPAGQSFNVYWYGPADDRSRPPNVAGPVIAYSVEVNTNAQVILKNPYPVYLRIRFLYSSGGSTFWSSGPESGNAVDPSTINVSGIANPSKSGSGDLSMPPSIPFILPSGAASNPSPPPSSSLGSSQNFPKPQPTGRAHPSSLQNQGGNLPNTAPAPAGGLGAPGTTAAPGSTQAPGTVGVPGTTGTPGSTGAPGYNSAAPSSNHVGGSYSAPGGIPTSASNQQKLPDTIPKTQDFTAPKQNPPPPAPSPDTTNKQSQDDNSPDLSQILTALAAITVAIDLLRQGQQRLEASPPPLTPGETRQAAADGVCSVAGSGGCLGQPLNDIQESSDEGNNKLDDLSKYLQNQLAAILGAINALLNGLDLAKLAEILADLKKISDKIDEVMNAIDKIGTQLGKLSKWLQLDRVLNILTWIQTLQNAYFLCDSLKIVTLQMISDGLSIIGLHDANGQPLDLNKIIGSEIEELLKSVLGVETLEGMKKEWKALNRIYQAATNMMFAIQNMMWSVLNALNVIGSWNAQIGNALKKYGVVGHLAFGWMNASPNFHNKFFTGIFNAINVVTQLDFVAQSILQGRQAIDDIGKQSEDFKKELSDLAPGEKPPENKPTKDAAEKSEKDSKGATPTPEQIQSLQ